MISVHPPVILFDFDGVILNSRGSLLVMASLLQDARFQWDQEVKDQLTPVHLVRKFEGSSRRSNYASIKAIYMSYQSLLPSKVQRWRFMGHVGRVVRRYEWKYNDLVAGAHLALTKLADLGCIMGIISNSRSHRLQKWLNRINLASFFSVVISRDNRKEYGVKPSPGPIIGALLTLKRIYRWSTIDKSLIAFVGDNVSDVLAAQRAQVKSVAVLSGHGFEDELRATNPDFILASIKEIPSQFDRIFSNKK